MQYLAKFDDGGNRITSIVEGIHYTTKKEKEERLADGYIEITEEEQNIYATNQYVRGVDGKPQKKEVINEKIIEDIEYINPETVEMAETVVDLYNQIEKIDCRLTAVEGGEA